ncbi:MAG TPA: hypothetical protein VG796_23925 [Verrucomicrobiales bacterium]|nr:hypothetical protein [Verrucomicrobiales bacterium]
MSEIPNPWHNRPPIRAHVVTVFSLGITQWSVQRRAVIACAESHLRIYSAALRKGEPALIFEDDTRLFAPAPEFHSAVAEAPEGWDMIHFHSPAHYDGIVERTEGHTARLRALQTVGFGAVAYAVSPAGIYKIMRAAYPLDRPIDVTIREIANLRAYRTAQPFASRDGASAPNSSDPRDIPEGLTAAA